MWYILGRDQAKFLPARSSLGNKRSGFGSVIGRLGSRSTGSGDTIRNSVVMAPEPRQQTCSNARSPTGPKLRPRVAGALDFECHAPRGKRTTRREPNGLISAKRIPKSRY